jgi:hypothetical protein
LRIAKSSGISVPFKRLHSTLEAHDNHWLKAASLFVPTPWSRSNPLMREIRRRSFVFHSILALFRRFWCFDGVFLCRTVRLSSAGWMAGWRRLPRFGVCDVPKGQVCAARSVQSIHAEYKQVIPVAIPSDCPRPITGRTHQPAPGWVAARGRES